MSNQAGEAPLCVAIFVLGMLKVEISTGTSLKRAAGEIHNLATGGCSNVRESGKEAGEIRASSPARDPQPMQPSGTSPQ